MKKLSILPRWLIIVIAILLCLIFAKVVFPTKMPKEVRRFVSYLAAEKYDSLAVFCVDTVVFGGAYTDGREFSRDSLIMFLKRWGISDSLKVKLKRFPKGFMVGYSDDGKELGIGRWQEPRLSLIFRKEKDIWKLRVLGIPLSEK